MSFIASILVFALWIPAKSNFPIILFAALYGFATGSMISLAPVLISQISDIREIGFRAGIAFSWMAISALISNPIGGALVDVRSGSFWKMQVFTGVAMATGCIFFVLARLKITGLKIMAKF